MSVKPKDAATIILMRNSPDPDSRGFEVLMGLRSPRSKFVPNLYVFPGGGLDEADCLSGMENLCTGMDRKRALHMLDDISSPEKALGVWVAGIRETFEEVGLLLAYTKGGSVISLNSEPLKEMFLSHRQSLLDGKSDFYDIIRDEGLILATDQLHYFSHWITPSPFPIRYDVRFFVAEAPSNQRALHDGTELTEHLWITPEEALERFHKRTFDMALPTVITMEELAGHKTIEDVIQSV
ncbi:MAG: NUDIX hydrolase [Deltaproteobacteria bacterium]|nr:NUDIX hydrolase [Deltaproteobacteria bacterium]